MASFFRKALDSFPVNTDTSTLSYLAASVLDMADELRAAFPMAYSAWSGCLFGNNAAKASSFSEHANMRANSRTCFEKMANAFGHISKIFEIASSALVKSSSFGGHMLVA